MLPRLVPTRCLVLLANCNCVRIALYSQSLLLFAYSNAPSGTSRVPYRHGSSDPKTSIIHSLVPRWFWYWTNRRAYFARVQRLQLLNLHASTPVRHGGWSCRSRLPFPELLRYNCGESRGTLGQRDLATSKNHFFGLPNLCVTNLICLTSRRGIQIFYLMAFSNETTFCWASMIICFGPINVHAQPQGYNSTICSFIFVCYVHNNKWLYLLPSDTSAVSMSTSMEGWVSSRFNNISLLLCM